MGSTDERDLRTALQRIREAVPTAVAADFESSDQGSYGFTLDDVTLADGTYYSDVDPDALELLRDDVNQDVQNISWRGVMHEDRGGGATVDVPETFDEEQADEDRYMADLLTLIDAFNYERCEVCQNDLSRHTIGPDPLGKPHLFCLANPEVELAI